LKGGEREPNQILMQELAYISSSNSKGKILQEDDEHTNQQHRNDPLEVTNTTEKNGINWTPGWQDMTKTVNEGRAESLSRTKSGIFTESPRFSDRVW
jgi:hypothetical protein